MSVTVLYEEGDLYEAKDSIYVQLRVWSSDDMRIPCDAVLEVRVKVDGKVEVCSREIINEHMSNAQLIRLAIAKYDELMEAHPAKLLVNWIKEPAPWEF